MFTFFTLLFALNEATLYNSLTDLIEDMELKVSQIAKKAEDLHQNRCEAYCNTLSYHGCANMVPSDLVCSEGYPDSASCNTTARKVSFGTSVIREAKILTSQNKTEALSLEDEDIKRTICAFNELDQLFKENSKSEFIKWQYFGTRDGMYRGFPWKEMCSLYDPRQRPWYVAGSSGTKNLVLILDISGSMNAPSGIVSRLQLAKDAVTQVVDGLTNSDWVGFISFSSGATAYQNKLVRATLENKALLKTYIMGLQAQTTTNYEAGFIEAFKVFKTTMKGNDKTGDIIGCTNVIQFMTDGVITAGMGANGDSQVLLDKIKALNKDVQAWIFTYSIGQDASLDVPKQIACLGNGVWTPVRDTDNLRIILTSYFSIIASGIVQEHASWTEPYKDASGLGEIVSVVMPAYDRTFQHPRLIGVASMDLSVTEFTKFKETQAITQMLISRSRKCSIQSLSPCMLETLRDDLQKCNFDECNSEDQQQCDTPLNGDVLYSESKLLLYPSKGLERCCGKNISIPSSNENLLEELASKILRLIVITTIVSTSM